MRFTPSRGTTSSRPNFTSLYTVGRDRFNRFAASVNVQSLTSVSSLLGLPSVPFRMASTFASVCWFAANNFIIRLSVFIVVFPCAAFRLGGRLFVSFAHTRHLPAFCVACYSEQRVHFAPTLGNLMRIRFPSVLAKPYLRYGSVEAKMWFSHANQLMPKEILLRILGKNNAGTSKIKNGRKLCSVRFCLLAMAKNATSPVAYL